MAKRIKSAIVFAVFFSLLLATEIQTVGGSYCQKELPTSEVSCSEVPDKCYSKCESLGYEDGACLPIQVSGDTCVCMSGACPKSVMM